MDLCTGGDLIQFVMSHETYEMRTPMYFPPSKARLAGLLWQMLHSIRYIHHYGIVHRDIKRDNFLLAKQMKGDDIPDIKLIDFGLAKFLKPGELVTDLIGTAGYMAPEVLRGGGYGFPCDAWSMGICAYMLLTGNSPIVVSNKEESKDPKALLRLTEETEISYKHASFSNPKEGLDLVKDLLQKDPLIRASPKQILSRDAWLRAARKGEQNCCCTVS
jgi:serine/threonine protein kinase